MNKKFDYQCPFEVALDNISGRWKGLILWHLCEKTYRYGELRRELGDITQKMLTQSLRDLEKNGLISRKVYPVVPPKVEYSITELGKKVQPILFALQEWGREIIKENNIDSCKYK